MNELLSNVRNYNLSEETFLLVIIFITTTLVVVSIALLVISSKTPIRRQLEDIRREMGDSNAKIEANNKIDNTLESLAPILGPKNQKERESVRHHLMHAGFHDVNALTMFYAIKILTFILGLLGASSIFFFYSDLAYANLLMIVIVAVGLFIPNLVLNKLVKKRQFRIRSAIPDALDLLVVCTESGLGFNAALKRVAEVLDLSHPEFADELDTVCIKVSAGVELNDAFEELIKRTGVEEIIGLIKMLAHASKIGGSLSQTLREYTEDYRDKRNQEIEEIAAKIPTKMVFPLLVFIWPCFFIVAVGPSLMFLFDMLES